MQCFEKLIKTINQSAPSIKAKIHKIIHKKQEKKSAKTRELYLTLFDYRHRQWNVGRACSMLLCPTIQYKTMTTTTIIIICYYRNEKIQLLGDNKTKSISYHIEQSRSTWNWTFSHWIQGNCIFIQLCLSTWNSRSFRAELRCQRKEDFHEGFVH